MAANTPLWDVAEREGMPLHPSASQGVRPDEVAAAKEREEEREGRSATPSETSSEMSIDQGFQAPGLRGEAFQRMYDKLVQVPGAPKTPTNPPSSAYFPLTPPTPSGAGDTLSMALAKPKSLQAFWCVLLFTAR